jgi:autotransporter-associated beta strand protein
LEGDGAVYLSGKNLTVGSNNLDTTFAGEISHTGSGLGGYTPGSDSLTKIGAGKLTLSGANLYSGGTTIKRGRLLVNNTSGSGTGSGPVFVNGGALGGTGTIAGAVTIGNGSGSRALLAPGLSAPVPGRLIIQSALTYNSDATYKVQFNSTTAEADRVVANGVTINTGAQFTLADLGNGTLPTGTVFTIINNTSASPIAGIFSNLPDSSTFVSGGNTFKANYEGGDGNNLTLTVVP